MEKRPLGSCVELHGYGLLKMFVSISGYCNNTLFGNFKLLEVPPINPPLFRRKHYLIEWLISPYHYLSLELFFLFFYYFLFFGSFSVSKSMACFPTMHLPNFLSGTLVFWCRFRNVRIRRTRVLKVLGLSVSCLVPIRSLVRVSGKFRWDSGSCLVPIKVTSVSWPFFHIILQLESS